MSHGSQAGAALTVAVLSLLAGTALYATDASVNGQITDPQGTTVAGAKTPQLSAVVVDASGAVIAGAAVVVQDANGTVYTTTRSDKNGTSPFLDSRQGIIGSS